MALELARPAPAVRYVRRRMLSQSAANQVATTPAPAPQANYSFAAPAQAPSPYSMAPQAQSAAPRPAAAPTYYGPHASPYAAATGNADAGYAAFDRIRNAPDSGFAYDALRNDRNAQTELYLGNANASTSFDNWMRRNTDTFYNRYVADSAQANNPSMQFSDWMHQQNLGAEFLQQSPENRGYFQGIASPAARWVV